MNPCTAYDLVRVLADQQAGLREQLERIDEGIEEMDSDKISAANADIVLIADCMQLLAMEVTRLLDPTVEAEDDDVYL